MMRLQQTNQVLGTTALITLILPDSVNSDELFSSLWEQIYLFDKKFSRFSPDSELSKFNIQSGKTVIISSEFKRLLETSKLMSQKTSGVYNPFILPGLERAGYTSSWTEQKSDKNKQTRSNKSLFKYDELIINQSSGKIPANSALDLGGIGKGYLLDQLSEFLEHQGIRRYWLSLGGDIICNGTDIDGKPWLIGVASAYSAQTNIEQISNKSSKLAIATSGILKRSGTNFGKKWHHLINPATNEPAITDVLTAAVCADTAVAADIAAKCMVIIGHAKAQNIARKLPVSFMLLQIKLDEDHANEKVRNVGIIKKEFTRKEL